MMSSLAWIDFDEAERQRARRIMDLFQESESRDELGLGGIRDSIADHLFPGTSTIQTRLRYMLFVPWLLRMLEVSTGTAEQLAAEARGLELRLANALKAGGETKGIIGRDAGANLKRLPSSVYWAGLGSWGIRVFPGSTDSLFSTMRQLLRGRQQVRESEESRPSNQFWTHSLPPRPEKLLDSATFRLSIDEAQFIVDRLVSQQPNSLLTFLAKNVDGNADCTFIWEHPGLATFPATSRTLVAHGEIFSSVMHGASLLYNLLLSRLRDNAEWIEHYEARVEEWQGGLNISAVAAWSLEDFWRAVDHPAHRIPAPTKRFVAEWLEAVRGERGPVSQIASSMHAAALVRDRERRLKTNQSRFTNHAARDRWGGASGAERLTFRWHQAKSHLQDLVDAR